MTPAGFTLLMDLVFIVPTVLIGTFFLLDRFGRKPVQTYGYIGAALVLILFAILHQDILHDAALGLVLFGAFNVLIMGPSMVSGSGILGVELAPTRIRTVAQSITVVGGRLGASLSAFVFPLLFVKLGEVTAIAALAGLSIIGAILTQIVIPETAARSLEDLSGEVMEASAAE
jgi:sugar phosphate permease